MGYAHDLPPQRGYIILDERDLVTLGKPRFVVAERVQLLGIDNKPISTSSTLRRASSLWLRLPPAHKHSFA